MTHSIVEQFYREYFQAPENRQLDVAQTKLNPDVKFCVAHPINDLHGPDKSHQSFLSPLKYALPDIERRPQIIVEGEYENRYWYNSTGYFIGVFENELFGSSTFQVDFNISAAGLAIM